MRTEFCILAIVVSAVFSFETMSSPHAERVENAHVQAVLDAQLLELEGKFFDECVGTNNRLTTEGCHYEAKRATKELDACSSKACRDIAYNLFRLRTL